MSLQDTVPELVVKALLSLAMWWVMFERGTHYLNSEFNSFKGSLIGAWAAWGVYGVWWVLGKVAGV